MPFDKYDYKIINIAIMKKNVQRSVKITAATSSERGKIKSSISLLKSLKFYLFSSLMMVMLCLVNTTKAQIITEGFEGAGWVSAASNTGTICTTSSTTALSVSSTFGAGTTPASFAYNVPFPLFTTTPSLNSTSPFWGTRTNFTTSYAVVNAGNFVTAMSASTTNSANAVVAGNNSVTMSITSKWQVSTYYSIVSGLPQTTTSTYAASINSSWTYAAAAVVNTSNLIVGSANRFAHGGNQAIFLDGGTVRGFIVAPVLSGLVSVTLNVYAPTANNDLYVLVNTLSTANALANTGSLSKTIATDFPTLSAVTLFQSLAPFEVILMVTSTSPF